LRSLHNRVFWIGAVALFLVLPHNRSPRTTTEELLEKVRHATGYEHLAAWGSGLWFEGGGKASGMNARFSYLIFSDGRFQMSIDARIGGTTGYDGRCGWQVDYTGMTYPLECWELEVAKLVAWTFGGYWLNPSCPLKLDLMPSQCTMFTSVISVRILGGVVEAAVYIDRRTYLPQKVTWQIYGEENSVSFRDYKQARGVTLPHHLEITEDGDVLDFRVERIAPAEPLTIDACQAFRQPPPDTDFDPATPPSVESRMSPHGLLVRAVLNEDIAAWFILDSGTSCNVIDKSLAKELRLERYGKGKAVGSSGTEDITFYQADLLSLGPLRITRPVFVEGRFGYRRNAPNQDAVVGILGFDLLARCLLEIDVGTLSVSIYRPGDYSEDGLTWEECVFCHDVPAVHCTLADNLSGLFTVDLGYAGTVLLHTPFVKTHQLLESSQLEPIQLEGIGGTVPGYRGYIDWFEIGSTRITRPVVVFSDSDRGASADRATSGTIGGGLLSQFERVVFDYSNKRIGLLYGMNRGTTLDPRCSVSSTSMD
jgi:hypothetical protein